MFLMGFSIADLSHVPIVMADTSSLFTSMGNMLINLNSSLGNIHRLVSAVAYLLGVFFITAGMIDLKHLADYRNMMSSGADLKKVFLKVIAGVCLIWLPYSLQVVTMSLWGSTSPLSYDGSDGNNITLVLYRLMKIVGLIAMIRGFLLMSHGTEQGQSTTGRALTHIIGGALAYNASSVQSVMNATFFGTS